MKLEHPFCLLPSPHQTPALKALSLLDFTLQPNLSSCQMLIDDPLLLLLLVPPSHGMSPEPHDAALSCVYSSVWFSRRLLSLRLLLSVRARPATTGLWPLVRCALPRLQNTERPHRYCTWDDHCSPRPVQMTSVLFCAHSAAFALLSTCVCSSVSCDRKAAFTLDSKTAQFWSFFCVHCHKKQAEPFQGAIRHVVINAGMPGCYGIKVLQLYVVCYKYPNVWLCPIFMEIIFSSLVGAANVQVISYMFISESSSDWIIVACNSCLSCEF